jgi:methylated-DNA-[protein]-cysteine S-methyltransferase
MIDVSEPAVRYSIHESPIGDLLLTCDVNGHLTGLYMSQNRGTPTAEPARGWLRDDRAMSEVRDQLSAYFDGRLRDFDLPLSMHGTPFQELVWEGLRAIPYGVTVSYAELADRIGRPGASRAVGSANGRNPISIIVPCHRVIAANGTLGGFGGGLDRKEWLLEHEAVVRERGGEKDGNGRQMVTCLMAEGRS